MNAIAEVQALAPAAAPRAIRTFVLMLRREFWEHKGRFVWTPVLIGAVVTLFALITAVAVIVIAHQPDVTSDQLLSPQDLEPFGIVGDVAVLGGIGLALMAQAFVVFFYTLHCLYNDRRDRSILFWKSMPISDTQMVLSKAVWALILAPLIAIPIGIGIGLVLWTILLITTAVISGSGSLALLTTLQPLQAIGELLLAMPVQILWSLPAVGWFMLCSAWSRREPILWAVMLPLLGCSILSFMDIFPHAAIPHGKFWYPIAYRGLLSIFPGSWIIRIYDRVPAVNDPKSFAELLNLRASWLVLQDGDVWIGAILGIAMIGGAILLRRRQGEI